jgi:iron complex outermembrane receptor protein
MMRRAAAMTTPWTLLATVAGAAEWPLPTEQDFLASIPTVSSAARLERSPIELGMSITVIDREAIEASPAIEIPDLLRLVPGFQVGHATGAVFAPGYHGANDQWPRRMEVLVDGRSVFLNTVAAVEWSALGLAKEDIERIEVVRGPNAPSFGSNAVFGSINFVTRAPFMSTGTYVRGTFGSQDTANGVVRWGGPLGKWETALTAQYRSDDGFDGVDDDKALADLRFRGDYQAGATDSWSLQLGLTDGEVGADGVDGEPFNRPRERDIRSHYQYLRWDRQNGDAGRYRVHAYHNYFDNDDSYRVDIAGLPTALPPPFPPVYPSGSYTEVGYYATSSERYDIEFQHDLVPRGDWRLAWGLGGRYDEIESDLQLGERGRVDSYSGRVFGSLEWQPLDDLRLGLDALTEFHEGLEPETSPRIGLNWKAGRDRSFRASASRSYRVFPLLARYIDQGIYPRPELVPGLGTPLFRGITPDEFEPEKVTAYEIGYRELWRKLGLTLDLRLFHEKLEDSGVALENDDGPSLWRDRGGGWTTRGLDLQLDFRPTSDTRLIGAWSWAETNGKVGTEADAGGSITRYEDLGDTTPLHTLSLLLSHRFDPRWRGSLALYYMDDVRWRGEGSDVDAYTRLDLKLGRRFGLGGGDGELALIVHNLTGEEYDEFRSPTTFSRDGNVFDRRAYVQFDLEFD